MHRVAKGQDDVVEHDLVLLHSADDIYHNVGLALVEDDAVVVEDDVGGLLCCLLEESFLEGFLGLEVGVCRCARLRCSR